MALIPPAAGARCIAGAGAPCREASLPPARPTATRGSTACCVGAAVHGAGGEPPHAAWRRSSAASFLVGAGGASAAAEAADASWKDAGAPVPSRAAAATAQGAAGSAAAGRGGAGCRGGGAAGCGRHSAGWAGGSAAGGGAVRGGCAGSRRAAAGRCPFSEMRCAQAPAMSSSTPGWLAVSGLSGIGEVGGGWILGCCMMTCDGRALW